MSLLRHNLAILSQRCHGASVYLGRQSRDVQAINGKPDELVLKVLTPKPDAGGCDDEIEILRKEGDVLANIQGHPNTNGYDVGIAIATSL